MKKASVAEKPYELKRSFGQIAPFLYVKSATPEGSGAPEVGIHSSQNPDGGKTTAPGLVFERTRQGKCRKRLISTDDAP